MQQWTFHDSYAYITQSTKKMSEEFGSTMWILQGVNVAKNNLAIMDVNIVWLDKKPMKILEG